MVLEMTASIRVLILTIDKWYLMQVFICAQNLATCFNNVTHHMNPYKICHFSIHFFTFKQLKGKVCLLTTSARLSLYLHVIKINFSLANSRSKYDYLLALSRLNLNLLLLGKQWRLISQKVNVL